MIIRIVEHPRGLAFGACLLGAVFLLSCGDDGKPTEPQPDPVGACCLPGGACEVLTEAACDARTGVWQGEATVCDPNPCPQVPAGACCLPDGSCEVLTEAACTAQTGVWQGEDTVCDPNPCPQPPAGACCLPDGSCEELTLASCAAQSGAWQGAGTGCKPDPCPPPVGACCPPVGACRILTEAECRRQSGDWLGYGTVCDLDPCTPLRIEAESYFNSYDIALQGIRPTYCGEGTSGGIAVDGLDYPGEFLEYVLMLDRPYCFVIRLRSAGVVGHVREFELRFLPEDQPGVAFADTVKSPPGMGYG